MSENILEKIATQVRKRMEVDKVRASYDHLLESATRRPHDFAGAFSATDGPATRVIAEVKLASPSEGEIAPGADPVAVARAYLENGATALSVLTERDAFNGHPDFIRRIRAEFPDALLLMKDFIVDEYQIAVARNIGADAVLLIVALLGADGLKPLLTRARSFGLSVLVEVHDEAELTIALKAGATLIGVNNRNLKTMQVSLETSERLAREVPPEVTLISESGIREGADIAKLRACGYRGFLVGTSLMKSGEPGPALAKLIGAAR